jgi:hypothetical protein
MASSKHGLSARTLADEIDRALVADGLRDEWTLSEVVDIVADHRGVTPEPVDVATAFGVLDSGGWWYRAEPGKIVCTFREAGAPPGRHPDEL